MQERRAKYQRLELRAAPALLALLTASALMGCDEQGGVDQAPQLEQAQSEQAQAGAQGEAQDQAQDTAQRPAQGESRQLVASTAVEHDKFWSAFAYAEAHPDAEPPKTNDWNCKLSSKHPRPVVLVHGTWVNQYDSFAKMAPVLAEQGWCLYSFNFGKDGANLPLKARYGTGALNESAKELKAFTTKVLDKTGADKVDMVGWSQGGVLIRTYLKDEGGADPKNPDNNLVQNVVTLGSPHRGTTLSGIALLGNLLGITTGASDVLGQGPIDQAIGSDFIKALNEGPETFPGIHYTSLYTVYDEITNPVTTCILKKEPGATVRNINIQEGCLIDFSEHLGLPFTDRVIAMTAAGLDPENEYEIPCKLEIGSI